MAAGSLWEPFCARFCWEHRGRGCKGPSSPGPPEGEESVGWDTVQPQPNLQASLGSSRAAPARLRVLAWPGAAPSHLEIPESSLEENCSPRFSCRQRGTRRRVRMGGWVPWWPGDPQAPRGFPQQPRHGGHSPLQGLSSFSIPLHRNWSVTTSPTSVRLGNVFLCWETTSMQLALCGSGGEGERGR